VKTDFKGFHPHESSRTVDMNARRSPLLTIPLAVVPHAKKPPTNHLKWGEVSL
jgi:hypothetical protein